MNLKKTARNLTLGVLAGGSLILGLTQSVQANYRHHLDVHRYCQRVWAQGGQWNGRQYTSDGWHHYNSTANRHECHFDYINLGEQSTGGNGGVTFGPFTIGGSRQDSRSTVGAEIHRGQAEVYLNKACREQNNNDSVWAEQDEGEVWCIFPQ